MQVLIAVALKSLLIAGLTLGLLALTKRRSAAERSWVAHVGLLALVIIAFAPLVMPTWNVEAPALLGQAPAAQVLSGTSETGIAGGEGTQTLQSSNVGPLPHSPAASGPPPRVGEELITPAAAATAAYALPAAILLFVTLLALARLIALRARAEVLVDGHWLTALARAQRRMGFKHGTALLTSNALASPISWGLMRPVILLNRRAVEASAEAEAIIAHELAHVARMDWAKLMLARVATALFWFNPLVWLLAREAHPLREEAADDAVLASDVADTDYAQLLVGVARHQCPGLLLGAHGVAPSNSSLARRVSRVLDATSGRGPAARPFALGVFAGAVLIAAPLAALTLTPGGPRLAKPLPQVAGKPQPITAKVATDEAPSDLPHIIASGVSTSVAAATAAVSQADTDEMSDQAAAERADAEREAAMERANAARDEALQRATAAREEALQRAATAREAALERAQAITDRVRDQVRAYGGKDYALRAAGLTPEYVAAIRNAAPQLDRIDPQEFASLKAVGVTPAYIQDLAKAGLGNLTLSQLVSARTIGLTGDYVRAVAKAGVRPDVADLIEFRTMGITPAKIARARAAGARTNGEIVEMALTGFRRGWPFEGLRPPAPPRPPHSGRPAASPPDWKVPDPGG